MLLNSPPLIAKYTINPVQMNTNNVLHLIHHLSKNIYSNPTIKMMNLIRKGKLIKKQLLGNLKKFHSKENNIFSKDLNQENLSELYLIMIYI